MSNALIVMSCLLASQPDKPAQNETVNQFEQNFGGRHWTDAKLTPPKTPREALETFQLPPGLRIELVASEPLVIDPVAITFDHLGRMYAVEYRDYPSGPATGEPPMSRIRLLEDSDGDGRMDRSTVYADQLSFAHSLMPLRDGILVATDTEIIELHDSDADGRADQREVLFRGFKPDHPQRHVGNPRWGMDNWIYMNFGVGNVTCSKSPDRTVAIPRLEFRFHPVCFVFEPASGLGQYGNTIDRWGHRFFCSNRNPIMTAVIPHSAVQRNPFALIAQAYEDVAPGGWETRVYPLVDMRTNWLAHAGTHTAACGVTAYVGDLLGSAYADNVFVCEPTGHLVTRSVIRRNGVSLKAVRARPNVDFLCSTDTWFLPASLANGPDGALYVADMYRAYAEHPRFLPEEVARKLNLRAGDDRGRIYRILPSNAKARTYSPPKTTAQLVAMLEDPNGWRRYTAQRLLVERQDIGAATALDRLSSTASDPVVRLHALWTLDGLGVLDRARLSRAIEDQDPHVRKDAVVIAARQLHRNPGVFDLVSRCADDADIGVRFQVALALGNADSSRATALLIQLALNDVEDHWHRQAMLTSARGRSAAILSGLMRDVRFVDEPTHAKIELVRALAGVAGARGDAAELQELFGTMTRADTVGAWWQTASLTGLATGLRRHRGELGRVTLAGLLADPPSELRGHVAGLQRLLARTAAIADDPNAAVNDRVAAIGLLGYQSFDQFAAVLEKLIRPDQPVEVRQACIAAMRTANDDRAAGILIKHWPTLGPALRTEALELCFRKTTTTQMVLQAMSAGQVEASAASPDQRLRTVRHRDDDIRAVAIRLFGGAVSENRGQVIAKYKESVSATGNAESGRKVFTKICASCHKIDGQGHDVGPEISDVRGRPREILLNDILDPGRAVDPKYTDYNVVTHDGRVLNGILISETAEAIVLRQAEGKQEVIARTEIEQLRASGKSLMPEGVEKDISVAQMADLLAFLKAPRPAETIDAKK